jgi:hypothetical protein
MSQVLEVTWLPEVEAEYRALLRENRDVGSDVGSDVGNQICEFAQLARRWNNKEWSAIGPFGSAYLYGLYGMHAIMFFAVCKRSAAVMKWAMTGTEHMQSLARDEAIQRTLKWCP